MTAIVPLTRKALYLILDAINARIAAETNRYTREASTDDAAGDYGNDLHYLRTIRTQLDDIRAHDVWHAKLYECWYDPDDDSVSLLQYGDAELHRAKALLSARATMRYTFAAATFEEASAIHSLRQGHGGYTPIGASSPCLRCSSATYPLGSGGCWRCGNQV